MRKLTITLDEATDKELGRLCALSSYDEKKMINHAITMYGTNAVGCYHLSLRVKNLEFQKSELEKQLKTLQDEQANANDLVVNLEPRLDTDVQTSFDTDAVEKADNGTQPNPVFAENARQLPKRNPTRR